MGQITIDNFFEIDIDNLTLNTRFGALIFEKANKQLFIAQKCFKELIDLRYQELLSIKDIEKIRRLLSDFIGHLTWLQDFDISRVDNAKAEHDSFENRVNSFYIDFYDNILTKSLLFLREERRKESPEQNKIDDEIIKITQIRSSLEKDLSDIKEEIKTIRETNQKVVSAKGVRASARMAVYFDQEVVRYNKKSKIWLTFVAIGYLSIVLLLIYVTSLYNKLAQELIKINLYNFENVFLSFSGKILLLAALWYGLSFIIKNYNVASQLTAVNRHRAAVAKTLEDFIAVEQQQQYPRLSEVLKSATESMFKHTPVGFVSKNEKENNSPVLQIINDIVGSRNN